MQLAARSVLTRHRHSREAGRQAALEVLGTLAAPPKLCVVYMTINHDQEQFLQGLGEELGPGVPVVGCSGQGVMGRGAVYEDGYAASVLALGGGGLEVAVAEARDIQVESRAKGETMAEVLRSQLTRPAKATVLLYDVLCGVDMDVLLAGVSGRLPAPIVGGAAAHFFNAAISTTFLYFGARAFSKGAVAFSLAGDFSAELVSASGCAPVGMDMVITKVDGNMVLELDGRPALDVWYEITGSKGGLDQLANASIAFGVPPVPGEKEHLLRGAYYFDPNAKGMLLGAAIPAGTRVTVFHRTVEDVLRGTERMGEALRHALHGKRLHAVLGFECGGRTRPFLGMQATNEENIALQRRVGPDAAWAGVISWGELFPVGGRPGFHNYAFPLLALAD